jgi:EmrB/QacA subfamily drug resistance transporter
MAQNIEQLIVFRAIQGVGSGALLPISFTIIFSIFTDQSKAAKFTGLFAAVFGLSSVLGPQLGTWISDSFSWRWCFYINVPLGIISFIILLISLKETKSEHKPTVDYLGTIFLIITTISLMLIFEWGGKKYDWNSTEIFALSGLSIIGLILFLIVEKKAKEPILPLHLFKNKIISITSFVVFCQGTLMFSVITYIPIFAVGVLGKEGSNGLLTPMMVSVMVGASMGGLLLNKFSFRFFYVVVMISGIISSFILYSIGTDTPYYQVILLMVVVGALAIGPLMSVAQNAVTSSIPREHLGIANSLVAFWRNIGGIFGASIMATIVNHQMKDGLESKIPKGIPLKSIDPNVLLGSTDRIPPQILSTIRGVLAAAINHGFIFALIVCFLGFIVSLFLGKAKFTYQKK